jgi:hypothetical protein
MRARVSAKVESSCQASQSARLAHVPMTVRLLCPSSGMSNCPPIHPGFSWAAERRSRIAASQSGSQPVFSLTCVTTVIMSNELPRLGRRNANTAAAGLPTGDLHVGLVPGVSLPCHGMRLPTACFTRGPVRLGLRVERTPPGASCANFRNVLQRRVEQAGG